MTTVVRVTDEPFKITYGDIQQALTNYTQESKWTLSHLIFGDDIAIIQLRNFFDHVPKREKNQKFTSDELYELCRILSKPTLYSVEGNKIVNGLIQKLSQDDIDAVSLLEFKHHFTRENFYAISKHISPLCLTQAIVEYEKISPISDEIRQSLSELDPFTLNSIAILGRKNLLKANIEKFSSPPNRSYMNGWVHWLYDSGILKQSNLDNVLKHKPVLTSEEVGTLIATIPSHVLNQGKFNTIISCCNVAQGDVDVTADKIASVINELRSAEKSHIPASLFAKKPNIKPDTFIEKIQCLMRL